MLYRPQICFLFYFFMHQIILYIPHPSVASVPHLLSARTRGRETAKETERLFKSRSCYLPVANRPHRRRELLPRITSVGSLLDPCRVREERSRQAPEYQEGERSPSDKWGGETGLCPNYSFPGKTALETTLIFPVLRARAAVRRF
jgi:hypothetical protein